MLRRLALLFCLTLLAACGQETGGSNDTANDAVATAEPTAPPTEEAADAGEGVTAVASVYPLAWMAEAVAPGADVEYLAARGQDPHDLELSPRQRGTLESADVVAYLGAIDFQPQVEAAVSDAGGEVVDVADIVGDDALLHYDADAHSHDEEDAHGDDDHGHDDGGHGHDDDDAGEENDDHADEGEAVDPHVWFDAGLMAQVAERVGEAFATADPDNAEAYRSNASEVAAELEALDEEIAGLLGDCTFDEVIVSHEAYAYLLEPHGLEQHGVSGAGGHGEATPQQIANLVDEVREQGIPAVLTEPVEGRADAETVAREAGVELIDIYSLDIVDDEQAAQGYPALLRQQADAVAQAAECG
ncbi:MAG TPA: metal ABC transporter substrate-binding protein [Egibacteraceae bacterium]|nr:metal ABC transporter substrate-binding protein [Egibacteraceae bacterium]